MSEYTDVVDTLNQYSCETHGNSHSGLPECMGCEISQDLSKTLALLKKYRDTLQTVKNSADHRHNWRVLVPDGDSVTISDYINEVLDD